MEQKVEKIPTIKCIFCPLQKRSNTAYGFNGEFHASSETREAKNTAYAEECGAWMSPSTEYEGNGDSGCGRRVIVVLLRPLWFFDGLGVDSNGVDVGDVHVAVRPALHLNLSSSTLWSYAGKSYCERGGGSSQPTSTPYVSAEDKNISLTLKSHCLIFQTLDQPN
ncbi:MAG: hypothetical protein ACLTJ5_00895 [Clostridium sp.]